MPNRRTFLKSTLATAPLVLTPNLEVFGQAFAAPSQGSAAKPHFVAWGKDATGTAHKGPRAGSHLLYKVLTADTAGGLFLMEHSNMEPGGPARHRHFVQEEWFYLIDGGEVVMEIADQRTTLKPGDCILAPRNVPHVWAYVGEKPGRMLIAFTPAGKMESFFNVTSTPGDHFKNPDFWKEHEMELLGPPLSLKSS